MTGYLLEGGGAELERLRLQSLVWEPAGRRLLELLGDGTGRRVVDIGCGALGWLRALSEWVGPTGAVVGTDVDERLLGAAQQLVDEERLSNVRLVRDDLFSSDLDEHGFDLVHARFQIAPLGRGGEQVAAFARLLAPGGVVALEDPDSSTWAFDPAAPALERLVDLIREAFRDAGGDLDAGLAEADLLREQGLQPSARTESVDLGPGHPYLRLPLQFATSLEPRILQRVGADDLAALRRAAEAELADTGRTGTTFTLVQSWAVLP